MSLTVGGLISQKDGARGHWRPSSELSYPTIRAKLDSGQNRILVGLLGVTLGIVPPRTVGHVGLSDMHFDLNRQKLRRGLNG